jgi:hypothetical protein
MITSLLFFIGCELENPFVTSKKIENSQSTHHAKTQDCRVCHSYPQLSNNDAHQLHLLTAGDGVVTPKGGAITCLECHFGSVQSQVVFDTLAGDTSFLPILQNGTEFKGKQYSLQMDINTLAQFIRSIRDSTTAFNFPSLKTSSLHNNGSIDVSFPPNLLIPNSTTPAWNPKTLTCSAIQCHSDKKWTKE